jgi:endonuclease/exonuclease/phosphatase family metal-dependent hydrolase
VFNPESPVVDTFRIRHPKRGVAEGTASGFKPGPLPGARIDWIGVSKEFNVVDAQIDYTTKEGRTPSDHFPVLAVLSPKRTELRVLTYNIHHGEGTDGKVDLGRLAKVILSVKPDIVALQEVDKNTRRTSQVDQTKELAQLTGFYGYFGKAIDYDGGEYGQALLSRWPLVDLKVHLLPGTPDRERRIVFAGKVQAHGHMFCVATTHLHHNNAAFRKEQAEEINSIFRSSDMPVVLAGDFNALPESEPMALLGKQWQIPNAPSLWTFPSGKPAKQIDYVILKTASWTIREQTVVDEPVASDHRPMVTVVNLVGRK